MIILVIDILLACLFCFVLFCFVLFCFVLLLSLILLTGNGTFGEQFILSPCKVNNALSLTTQISISNFATSGISSPFTIFPH